MSNIGLIICVIIIAYLVTLYITVKERCSTSKYGKPRDPEPIDVWISLLWPIEWAKFLIWVSISFCNEIILYCLLLLGYRYNKSKLYKYITKQFEATIS